MVGEVGEVVTKHHHSGACFTAMSALKLPTVHDMIHPSGLLPTTVIPLAKLGCTTAQAGHHDLPEILEILVAHDFGCPNWSRVAPKWSPQGLGRGGMTSLNTIVAFNSTHGGVMSVEAGVPHRSRWVEVRHKSAGHATAFCTRARKDTGVRR